MTCLIILALILTPRLLFFVLWIFTSWVDRAFTGFFWPLVGVIFAPYTTLWYAAVQNWFGGEWGFWQIVILVIAILADLSSNGSGAKKYKD